jgi:hypothetical protein
MMGRFPLSARVPAPSHHPRYRMRWNDLATERATIAERDETARLTGVPGCRAGRRCPAGRGASATARLERMPERAPSARTNVLVNVLIPFSDLSRRHGVKTTVIQRAAS